MILISPMRASFVLLTVVLTAFVRALHVRPLGVVTSSAAANASVLGTSIPDPASIVNVFIGTTLGGHVFPGATLPHGMAKVGMDTNSPGNVSPVCRDRRSLLMNSQIACWV